MDTKAIVNPANVNPHLQRPEEFGIKLDPDMKEPDMSKTEEKA